MWSPISKDKQLLYPKFDITVRWLQILSFDVPDTWKILAPINSFWNSYYIHIMFNTSITWESAYRKSFLCWQKYCKEKSIQLYDDRLPQISIKFIGYGSWCIGWFHHWTFDNGQADEEFVYSFEQYVNDAITNNLMLGAEEDGWWSGKYVDKPNGIIPLMGANDRYRWTDQGNTGRLPCRCEGCSKNGIVRIQH